MPQLDPSSFASQAFWLLVTFTVLYMVMVRKVLPKITGVLQNRQDKISNDLDNASKLRKEAEQLEEEYKASLDKTKSKANSIIANANVEMGNFSAKKHEELDDELFKNNLKAEEKIASARKKAIKDLSVVSSEISQAIVEKIANMKVNNKKASVVVKNLLRTDE